MVANVFKVKGLNVHLGYDLYSEIAKKCIERGEFSLDDMYSTTITSSILYPKEGKNITTKIYKSMCRALEDIADKNYDAFINHYYNQSYHDERAKENISDFLDGVATVYKHLYFRPDKQQYVRFPFGKEFAICCKTSKKNYNDIVIDTDDIECYHGSIDSFYIHFKSGFTIYFNRGNLVVYNEYEESNSDLWLKTITALYTKVPKPTVTVSKDKNINSIIYKICTVVIILAVIVICCTLMYYAGSGDPNTSVKHSVQHIAVSSASEQNQSETVYITDTGTKYHKSWCSSLDKSSIPISEEKAIAQNYEPCKKCFQ